MDKKRDLLNDPRLVSAQCISLTPVETIHTNPWFSVRNRKGYFTIEYNMPQVLILPIVDNKAIVMVRVDRPVIADITLELPAGGANENELPVEAAAREFKEETGIKISNLNRFQLLPSMVIDPNRFPLLPYIYQIHISAREYESRNAHDSEVERVKKIYFEDVPRLIVSGDLYISLPIAIICRFIFQKMTVKETME